MSDIAMNNQSDLDWLARNVHAWHPLRDLAVVQRADVDIYVTWPSACSEGITKDQWLARRAELQNKPSWDDFGESAKFMAQDSDGAWMAFESEPAANYHVWSSMRGWCGYAREGRDRCRGEVLGDWRDTLEKRPEQAAFAPFISTEDSQEQDMAKQQEMKQDSGWFERGELPPVGEVCEWLECNKTGWQEVIVAGYYMNAAWIVPKGKEPITVFNPTGFRPIRTERDVLLSVIVEEMNHYDTDGKLADAILAAGFSLRDK